MVDVYQMLIDELQEEFAVPRNLITGIVLYLQGEGFLDYDVLKEVFFGEDE